MKNLKGYFLSATAAALIASSIISVNAFAATDTSSSTSASTNLTEETQKTALGFSVYKAADLAETSSMANSMDLTSQIERTAEGKYFAYMTIKSASVWKSFKTEVNGEMVEAEKISEDKTANTAVVKIQVPSWYTPIKADIEIQAGPTLMTHTTYIKFDVEAPVVESKAFKVWDEKKTAISSMAQFMETPAKVTTINGKKIATVTISGASMWKNFKTEVNGELVEVTTVSEDKTKDTKVVSFEVPSYDALIKTQTLISVPNVYETTHITYLDFNNLITIKPPVVKPPIVTPVDPNKVISTTKYNYKLVTKTKKANSAVNKYMAKPIKVEKTKAGKYYATVKLKNASMWKSLKTEVNGKMTAVKTVSTDTKAKTKTVKFQVKSPKAVTKTTFSISSKDKKLAGEYTNYIKVSTVYKKPATVVSTKKYNYTVLKDNKKSTSVTNGYMVKPATIVKMSDGKYYATVTIKNANWWKSFKTNVNGKMTAVKTISTNKAKNTKVVKFQIAAPTKQVKTTIHIKSTAANYDGTYTNYLKFGKVVKK